MSAVECPACNQRVREPDINKHLDSQCTQYLFSAKPQAAQLLTASQPNSEAPSPENLLSPDATQVVHRNASRQPTTSTAGTKRPAGNASFFSPVSNKRPAWERNESDEPSTQIERKADANGKGNGNGDSWRTSAAGKRSFDDGPGNDTASPTKPADDESSLPATNFHRPPPAKRPKPNRAAPLAERIRPVSLEDVHGQDIVGEHGVLRALIEADQVPSMILWGASGTGKTTIARCIAEATGSRFIEINATNSGVAECKKLFEQAGKELGLTQRKTIIFCDEIHRFSKAQQDIFLKPVEAGTVTLIGATTENPSFRIQNALLSRCRTFTLAKLTSEDIEVILRRALEREKETDASSQTTYRASRTAALLDDEMIHYLAVFSDGDARTALNLLELSLSLAVRPSLTKEDIKKALTKTLVYDRVGDQHYDTISAFHKSVRGNDTDAALYYLARMLQSGEDPLFIARRLVVIASEDVGLADNTLLPLATSTYTATQQIGLPEARIPLAHCTVALCLAPKSTRAYRSLNNAMAVLKEPGMASLPIPLHLRNAPTRLMNELGYGAEYKYPPSYRDGQVRQTYLPQDLLGRKLLEDLDLGTEIDPDLEES